MNRSKMREHVFKMVFSYAFDTKESIDDHMDTYLEDVNAKDEEIAYMKKKVAALFDRKNDIDAMLNEVSVKWPVSRMANVDAAILRLMVYEIKYDEDIPDTVAMNEGIELAKRFGGDKSPQFVNGVIAKIVNG